MIMIYLHLSRGKREVEIPFTAILDDVQRFLAGQMETLKVNNDVTITRTPKKLVINMGKYSWKMYPIIVTRLLQEFVMMKYYGVATVEGFRDDVRVVKAGFP